MSESAAFLFLLLSTGLSLVSCKVGVCNTTYFISNGQQCQREMIKNLMTNPNTNCSYEYEREKSCLKTHVATCLSDYVDHVTSLLLHQLYHCGDLTYQPSFVNKFILGKIKCKDEAFMDTEFCWEYFRDKLNSNRSDPSLCREYALAKHCINEKVMANCEICSSLVRDHYNPFCASKSDPLMVTNGCQDLAKPLPCSSSSVYKAALDCERIFLKSFMENDKTDCGPALTTLKSCLDEQLSQRCKDDSNNRRVVADIRKAVMAVLRGPRFFCDAVNLRTIDLDFKARPMIPCKANFFPEMEKCAESVRMEFNAQNGIGGEFCSKFRTALSCSNGVQKSFCKFDESVVGMIQRSYSSFCVDGTSTGGEGRNNTASSTSASFALTLSAFVFQVPMLLDAINSILFSVQY